MQLLPFRPKQNAAMHVQHLLLLQSLANYPSDWPAIQRANPGVFNGSEWFQFVPPTATNPNILIVKGTGTYLVLAGGMTTLGQAAQFVQGWTLSTLRQNQLGFAPLFLNVANSIAAILRSIYDPTFTNFRFVGHSFGGACMNALWTEVYNPNLGITVQGASYGAPRTGQYYSSAWSDTPDWVRCFGYDDVVPNIPPWASESPSFALCLPSQIAQGCDTMIQPCNGLAIDGGGNITAAYQVPMTLSPFSGALANWLLGSQAEGSTPHSISTYLSRWQSRLPLPVQDQPAIPGRRLPGPQNVSRRQEEVATRAAVIQASQLAVSNPAAQIAATAPQLTLVKGTRFSRETLRGVRYVAYGSTLVCVCENKRNQRKMVRAYNQWLEQNPGFNG